MFRLLTKFATACLATLVLVGVSSALVVVPLKQKAAGVVTDIVPGHLSYAAAGQATHFGNYTVLGDAQFDSIGNVSGTDALLAADGSTLQANYTGTYTPLSTGQIRFDLSVTWHTGTGRLAGAVGQSNLVAILDGLAPGAAFRYESLGSITLH
jgi:hypothetical protein